LIERRRKIHPKLIKIFVILKMNWAKTKNFSDYCIILTKLFWWNNRNDKYIYIFLYFFINRENNIAFREHNSWVSAHCCWYILDLKTYSNHKQQLLRVHSLAFSECSLFVFAWKNHFDFWYKYKLFLFYILCIYLWKQINRIYL